MSVKRARNKWPSCRRCGSQINTKEKTEKTARGLVDIYLCRCGARVRSYRRG